MTTPTLSEALNRYLLIDRAAPTQATYTRFLTHFVNAIGPARPLNLVRPEDVAAFVNAMKRRRVKYADHPQRPTEPAPLSPQTVFRNCQMIKSFFRWCTKQGWIAESPAGMLTNRRPRRPLGQGKAITDEELDLLLAAARFKPRDYALVMLLSVSGCRAGEAAGLQIRDLDLEDCSAMIVGKGSAARMILFEQTTAEALRAWLACRPKVNHDYVFTSTRGHGPLTPDSVSLVIRRLCRTAGIRSLGAHSLRHRVGLKFAREHVAPRVTQHYLGHLNIDTTLEYYQDVDLSDLRQAGALLMLRGDWPEQAKQKPASKRLKKASSGG